MTSDGTLLRAGAALHYVISGDGRPVLFQHGLGGDAAQVAEVFPDGPRRVTLECRAQGRSAAGPLPALAIATFADDVLALADALGIERFVAGGISMGAAIAMRLAALHPDRVEALVLVRPAWLFDRAPANMLPFAMVADCLRTDLPAEARRRFAASAMAQTLAQTAPDNLASLLGFFDRTPPAVTAALLGQIAADGPAIAAGQISVPALVLGNAVDHVHPRALAEALAQALPDAQFVEVTAKARDRVAHATEVRAAIAQFLALHPPS